MTTTTKRSRAKTNVIKSGGNGKQSKPKEVAEVITIQSIKTEIIPVHLVGLTPYLSSRPPMPGKIDGLNKEFPSEKEALAAACYAWDCKFWMKSSAFWNAICSAAIIGRKKPGTIRQAIQMMDAFVEIKGSKPKLRKDIAVNHAKSTPAMITAIRAEFWPWSVTLRIRLNVNGLSKTDLFTLINLAGFGVGVGAWRPQCKGTFGTFEIKC